MTEPLSLALVGAGRIAQDYHAALSTVGDLRLAAVVDADPDARDRAATVMQAPVFASVREMLQGTDVDAALILTPPASHDDLALELLDAGKHVFCEKPIAMSVSAAHRMFQVAARHDRLLMMASKFRHVPDVLAAQRLIADGRIGEPIGFENSFCSHVDMSGRWNSDPLVAGGGVLIDNGTHSVDLARCFLGPIVKVFAHFGRRVQPIGVEDSVRLMIETVGGGTGVIELSWSFELGADYFVTVIGTRGTLQVGWRGSRYRGAGDRDWTSFGSGYDKRQALAAQLANFAGAARRTEPPLVTVDDAIESVRAIDAAYRSARVARWVPLQSHHGAL